MYYFKRSFKTPSLIMIFLTLSLLILLLKINADSADISSSMVPSTNKNLETMRSNFNKCLRKVSKVYYTESYRFFEELNICMRVYFPIDYSKFDVFPYGANGERKVFLPMAPEFYEEECKWLTIGIGGLAGAEELAHAKYPNCQIYGVEAANYGNFTKTGKLLKVGVGLEDKKERIVANSKLKEISLPRLLDEFVHSRLVHYLSIDIESYEMIVMKELVGNGRWVDEGITFCQIDAKIHDPKKSHRNSATKDIHRVQWLLDFLGVSSPYIPVFSVISYDPPQNVTFVNVVNPECEKAFKISSYF